MNKLINTSELSRLFTGSRTSIQANRMPDYVQKLIKDLIAEAQRVERLAVVHKLYTAKQSIPNTLNNDLQDYLYLIGADMTKEDSLGLAMLLDNEIDIVNMCLEYLERGYGLNLWKHKENYGIEIMKGNKCEGVIGLNGLIIKNNPDFVKVAELTNKIINKYKN
jgi:hypothetical protein